MSNTYCGAKFRPTGETYTTIDRQVNSVVREKFVPTKAYMLWLQEQKELKKQEELATLKSKLQYQFDKYGEVDPIDLEEYKTKLRLYCGIKI